MLSSTTRAEVPKNYADKYYFIKNTIHLWRLSQDFKKIKKNVKLSILFVFSQVSLRPLYIVNAREKWAGLAFKNPGGC